MRFCGNCGKPCFNQNNREPSRIDAVNRQRRTSGIWNFFAGTAMGAFLVHLFGGSSSASAASSHSTTEQFHETIICDREEDDDYDYDASGNSFDGDDWAQDDFNHDDYDDDYDDD